MKRAGVLLVSAWALACAGQRPTPQSVSDLDRMIASPAAREVARDAPEAFAEAVTAVRRAHEQQDSPTRAEAAAADARLVFERAQVVSALALARQRIEAAERAPELEADIARIEQETREIEAELARRADAQRSAAQARRAAQSPAAVAAPERRAAAAALRQQAALLVAAAVMLGADEAHAATVRERITAAERAGAGADANAALLASGGAYTAAERLLRGAREGTPTAAGATDGATLTTALSDAGGFEPHRDARGVIAVMRGLFAGAALSPAAGARVASLARVIAAHGDARVRVEVFVGGPARAPAEALAGARAEALATALRARGVPRERLQSQGLHLAGAVSPRDDRVDVVLVLPTEP